MIHPDTYFKKPDSDCFATVYGWCKYITGTNKVKLIRSHPNLEESYIDYLKLFASKESTIASSEDITFSPVEAIEDSIEHGLVDDSPIKQKKVRKHGTNSQNS